MKKRLLIYSVLLLSITVGVSHLSFAGWQDMLKDVVQNAGGMAGSTGSDNQASSVPFSNSDAATALKAALAIGVEKAVQELGSPGGFMKNPQFRIPMPESLSFAEKTLRKLGQDEMADQFVMSMNRAAEQATAQAADIFLAAVKKMTVEDAISIVKGPEDAATQYLRNTTAQDLEKRFLPIVQDATSKTGVTSAYKTMMSRVPAQGMMGGLGSLMGQDATDIDGYITQKAMDALFTRIAMEEKAIRENPLGQSSKIVQKVFGSLTK